MSWLARSISNDDDVVSYHDSIKLQPLPDSIDPTQPILQHIHSINNNNNDNNRSDEEDYDVRGVKEDLSELTQTLTRQFWGVASFLAPPPPPHPPLSPVRVNEDQDDSRCQGDRFGEEEDSRTDCDRGEGEEYFGIQGDRGEVGEDSRSDGDGFNVRDRDYENSRSDGDRGEGEEDFGSDGDGFNVRDLGEEDLRSCYYNSDDPNVGYQEEVEDAIGVTEEALTFAQNIGHHPETWLDFPLEEEDEEGFEGILVL